MTTTLERALLTGPLLELRERLKAVCGSPAAFCLEVTACQWGCKEGFAPPEIKVWVQELQTTFRYRFPDDEEPDFSGLIYEIAGELAGVRATPVRTEVF